MPVTQVCSFRLVSLLLILVLTSGKEQTQAHASCRMRWVVAGCVVATICLTTMMALFDHPLIESAARVLRSMPGRLGGRLRAWDCGGC